MTTQSLGYALVTGASCGIGEEFARQLAARGWSLILVARSRDRLTQLRDELMAAHANIDVRPIALDLAAPGAPLKLFETTQAAGLTVGLLINNAGFGAFGEFAALDRERQRRMLDLNIAAVVELSHLYLQPMLRLQSSTSSRAQRSSAVPGSVGIINIASVAGFFPLPYSAVYAASKAFVRSFSHALYQEARPHGVPVMVVNPGSTATKFFDTAGNSPYNDASRMQTAAQVVAESLRAFDHGRRAVTTGVSNRVLMRVTSVLPRSWIASGVARKLRPTMQTHP